MKTHPTTDTAAVQQNPAVTAYSYIRFSTPEQAMGNSLERQARLAASYCQRHGWNLDRSLTLRDLGVSAFRGKNALVGNLGTFLDAVARGLVVPGSALIVENVDRISRQGIDEGYDIVKRILKAGIHIVTLSPERDFGPEAVNDLSKGALEIQLILQRAMEESERKSSLSNSNWVLKRERLRETGKVMTQRLPAWLELKDGQPQVILERGKVIRLIFKLAASGYGYLAVTKKLNADKVPSFGKKHIKEGNCRSNHSGRWTLPYVALILNDRRAVGECQPRKLNPKAGPPKFIPDGPPVQGYYPAVVTEDEYWAAKAASTQRRERSGFDGKKTRVGKYSNLFAGLVRNGRDGESYNAYTKTNKRVLGSYGHQEGRSPLWSFPLDVFEAAVLECLREVNPAEILQTPDTAPDDTLTLAAELAGVEARMAQLEAELDTGDIPALARKLRELQERKRDLAYNLANARHKAAHPQSETWGEMQSLAAILANAADPTDVRLRLRSAIHRVVSDMWLVVVRNGANTLAQVRINFTGGGFRSYQIFYRSPGSRRVGRYYVNSIRHPTAMDAGVPFMREDLTNEDEVGWVISFFENYPREMLDSLLLGKHGKPLPR
jgi:DNA invertase Pin-like site-specific DNA recombinase